MKNAFLLTTQKHKHVMVIQSLLNTFTLIAFQMVYTKSNHTYLGHVPEPLHFITDLFIPELLLHLR